MPVRYRLSTGPGAWTAPFAGTLVLAAPTVTDYGDEFGYHYGATGSFVAAGVTYTINGLFLVHDQGAGLWDASFQVPVSTSDGHAYNWESATGTFFRADGSPYPGGGRTSSAYGIFPERITFETSAFRNRTGPGSSPLGTGTLIADRQCASAGLDDAHLKGLDKKITSLSNALATLGRGTDLKELLQIIRNPGWTTPAEYAFCLSLLDAMQAHTAALTELNTKLLAASKLVGP